MIIAGTMEERHFKRLAKSIPKSRVLIPEEVRTPCLKCNGIARKDRMYRSHGSDSGYCDECSFGWEIDDNGRMIYGSQLGSWRVVPAGLFLVIWEKEYESEEWEKDAEG